jgi:hypothetical protein
MFLIIIGLFACIFWYRTTLWAHVKWILTSEYVWLIAADLVIFGSAIGLGPELDDDPETMFLIVGLLFCNVFVGTHVLVYIGENLLGSVLWHVKVLCKALRDRFF